MIHWEMCTTKGILFIYLLILIKVTGGGRVRTWSSARHMPRVDVMRSLNFIWVQLFLTNFRRLGLYFGLLLYTSMYCLLSGATVGLAALGLARRRPHAIIKAAVSASPLLLYDDDITMSAASFGFQVASAYPHRGRPLKFAKTPRPMSRTLSADRPGRFLQ